ncbi:hypothetical protein RIF29_04635 [Crotalaria pallida]|uniref:Uncharacterized protein n=1 Tax=Crotalaria pallida TaxID=3830 RepID=A0AAN9PAH3_CROPI
MTEAKAMAAVADLGAWIPRSTYSEMRQERRNARRIQAEIPCVSARRSSCRTQKISSEVVRINDQARKVFGKLITRASPHLPVQARKDVRNKLSNDQAQQTLRCSVELIIGLHKTTYCGWLDIAEVCAYGRPTRSGSMWSAGHCQRM